MSAETHVEGGILRLHLLAPAGIDERPPARGLLRHLRLLLSKEVPAAGMIRQQRPSCQGTKG